MKKYFINGQTNESDALSFEELKSMGLTGDDYVWFDGLDDWKTVAEIEELRKLVKKSPKVGIDPFVETRGWKIIESFIDLLWILFVGWLIWCLYDKFTTGRYNVFTVKDLLLSTGAISLNIINRLNDSFLHIIVSAPVFIVFFFIAIYALDREKLSGKYHKIRGKDESMKDKT